MASKDLTFNIYGKDRSASSTMNDVGGSAERMGQTFRRVGTIVAASMVVAAGAIVKLGLDAVNKASDMSVSITKASAIFGENAKEVQDWAGTTAEAFGVSRSEALDAAASFGNMFQQLGYGRKEAATTSKSVVELAADLASFNKLPTADVVNMIAASFRGEYDSLQRVIPGITAARIQSEALVATGKKNVSQLTAQEKATATLAIIMKDGAAAVGSFERTSGSLAGQQKILRASVSDLQSEIGEALLPAMTDVVKYINSDVMPKFKEFGGWLKDEGIPKVGEFFDWWNKSKDEILPVLPSLIGAVTSAMLLLNAAMSANPIGAIIAGFTFAIGNLISFNNWLNANTNTITAWAGNALSVFGNLTSNVARMFDGLANAMLVPINIIRSLQGMKQLRVNTADAVVMLNDRAAAGLSAYSSIGSDGQFYSPEGMADGGIVPARPGGTLKRLGEAGVPEAALPLTDSVFKKLGQGIAEAGGNRSGNTFIFNTQTSDPQLASGAVYQRLRGALAI